MFEMKNLFEKTGELIKKANRILLIAHKKPDGDTLGAVNALYLMLKNMGKAADQACIDEIPERFRFLSDTSLYINEFNLSDYDLIFVVDAGASYMTKFDQKYPGIFDGTIPVINIDHHPSNDNFGTLNIVDVQSASTTMVIYKMQTYLGVRINPDMATGLLAGIYNDTGSLKHQNTTLEVFEISSKLVELGAKVKVISKNLFQTTSLATLRIWGRVLERAQVNEEGVTISVVTEQDFEECEATSEDLSGVVDFLNSVPGSKFTILLNEDGKGNVKGSFRTRREDIDLATFAEAFGGGGHKKASGFSMPGRLHREVKWKVLSDQYDQDLVKKKVTETSNEPKYLLSDSVIIPEIKKD